MKFKVFYDRDDPAKTMVTINDVPVERCTAFRVIGDDGRTMRVVLEIDPDEIELELRNPQVEYFQHPVAVQEVIQQLIKALEWRALTHAPAADPA